LAVKNVYLNPCLINEAQHAGLLTWKDDHSAFNGASGKARDKIRKAAHEKARLEVAPFIGNAMLAYQNFQYI
jgi:hypothetical protein